MSGIENVREFRECAGCGFEQTSGNGEFVLNCPRCGGMRWNSRRAE